MKRSDYLYDIQAIVINMNTCKIFSQIFSVVTRNVYQSRLWFLHMLRKLEPPVVKIIYLMSRRASLPLPSLVIPHRVAVPYCL